MLGANIRKWREHSGYTQEEFAHIVGFTRSYYTEIETGKRNISILNLLKILEVLDVDPNSLLDFSLLQTHKGNKDAKR